MNDYSQHGEGKVISSYFGDHVGTLVSLGENDGKTLSNVLHLIEKGWTADLVEPSIEAFNKLCELHDDRLNVFPHNFAIANHTGDIEFHESDSHIGNGDTSLLSSCIESEIVRWKDNKFTTTKVKCFTWDDFINNHRVDAPIDLISIDCEGMDLDILKQIDFEEHDVRMVVVEYNGKDKDKFINHMRGFKVLIDNGCNLIFAK